MLENERVLVTKKFVEDVRSAINNNGTSQNKFAKEIGMSGATFSDYMTLKFSIPLSVFQKIKEKLKLEDKFSYISEMTTNAEIHRKLARANKEFVKKRNIFKKGDPRTRELAIKAGKRGGLKGGPKVAEVLMKEGRGIFAKQHLNNRSLYAKKGGTIFTWLL